MTTEVRLDECRRAFEEEVGKLGRTETQKGRGDWMPIRAREKEAQVCDESLCCPVPLLLCSILDHSSSGSAVLPREENRGNGGVGRGVSPRVTDESEPGWDSTRDSGGQGRRQTPRVGSAKQVGSPFTRPLATRRIRILCTERAGFTCVAAGGKQAGQQGVVEGRLVETDRSWGLSNGFDRMELILGDPVAHAGRARDANAGETYRGRLRVCECACVRVDWNSDDGNGQTRHRHRHRAKAGRRG